MRGVFYRLYLTLVFFFPILYASAQNDSIQHAIPGRLVRAAADSTLKGNGIRQFLTGKNYRAEWTEPISMPVLNTSPGTGGVEVEKAGGGKETKSLHVKDTLGNKWSLRSVRKFPEKAMPAGLQNTVAEKIVQDAVSASYPYGVLSMGVLSNAAHVPYLANSLVFLPGDTALGKFRKSYGNLVMLLEEKDPRGLAVQENADSSKELKTLSTLELTYELQNKISSRVDQLSVLRARLLDNFVMDFDRHEDQWNWALHKSKDGNVYYVIPKDRDQVFYKGGGILTPIASNKDIIPELQGFRAKTRNINTFNHSAQNLDRYFLNGLTEQDWSREIDAFLASMTDSVIEAALLKQPKEIQKYGMNNIIRTLKEKRRYFKADMMKYYKFISETVSVVGTNGRELFTIKQNADGKVNVIEESLDSLGKVSSKSYERSFDPKITREIRIYGLEGDDKFIVRGEKSPIKIRLIGGPGNDQYINEGSSKNVFVYDVAFEQNQFAGPNQFKKKISDNPLNNSYERLGYRYNSTSPGISIEYYFDRGVLIGPKLKIVRQGFRKDPYASRQVLLVNRAITSSSFHIKYTADFIGISGHTDLLIRSEFELPTFRTLFFGLGNNSVFDKTKPGGEKYYLSRYNLGDISVMARTSFTPWLRFSYGPVFQYLRLSREKNRGKYVSAVDLPANAYASKLYGGGQVSLAINTKNDLLIPSRGVEFEVHESYLAGLNSKSNPISETGGHLSLYTDFISRKKLILVTSFGANRIFGNYEFEQGEYLGLKQNLRGYRFERFAGRSRAYNNSEIRFSFGNDVNMGLFHGSLGLLAFNDVGRVWSDNEQSKTWHDGYGFGLWVAPLNRVLLAGALTYSNEEKNLVVVTLGFQF